MWDGDRILMGDYVERLEDYSKIHTIFPGGRGRVRQSRQVAEVVATTTPLLLCKIRHFLIRHFLFLISILIK